MNKENMQAKKQQNQKTATKSKGVSRSELVSMVKTDRFKTDIEKMAFQTLGQFG